MFPQMNFKLKYSASIDQTLSTYESINQQRQATLEDTVVSQFFEKTSLCSPQINQLTEIRVCPIDGALNNYKDALPPTYIRIVNSNKGKKFYNCKTSKCKFFKWTSDCLLEEANPCKCCLPSQFLVVQKEGINKGRSFLTCKKKQNGCGFFKWVDDSNIC